MLKLSYQAVDDVVMTNDADASAAEAHGLLAGLLCANERADCEEWLSLVFAETRDELSENEEAVFQQLFTETRENLQSVDFSFELFLPDDETLLTERAQSLSDWCHGFLYGVGYAGAGREWPEDCAEVLHDLADISQLDSDASGEADEEAYAELNEFVRVGVQLLRNGLQIPPPKSRLH
jgi:hypothetical protein